MAKWEERDPRWIVEERSDGINVNNWHWTDKNASHWSKNKFAELFVGLKIQSDFGYCEVTEMLKCLGDAVVHNRKGKLLYFYEWTLEMKWNGIVSGGHVVEGRVNIIHFTEECGIKDVDIVVHIEDDDADSTALGNLMRSTGVKVIQEQLLVYVASLKDFSADLILPTHYSTDVEMVAVSKLPKMFETNTRDMSVSTTENKIKTNDLYTTEIFKCTAEEFYRVLTVTELVQAFTQSNCVLELEEGGKFQLFNGNVQGYFIKLLPFQKIVLKWRFISWPKDYFSDVVIIIDQKTDCTEVKLSQYGIPEEELENTRVGWKRHYWDSIKRTFGFGIFLF